MTNKEIYKEFCLKEPSICIYNQPWWLDAVCSEGLEWDVLIYEKKGQILGTLTYVVKQRFGIKYITTPPLTQHNGVWINYPQGCKYQTRLKIEKEVMGALIDQLELIKVSYYQQSFSPSVTNWLPFYWKGYKQTTRYTYRIDIARNGNYDEVFDKFSTDVKTNIKKARQHGIIREIDDLEIFHKLQNKTFERQGIENRTSFEFLKNLDSSLVQHYARKIFLVEDSEGEAHSAVYMVYDRDWVYELMSGTDPKYRKNALKYLLLECEIKFACKTNRGFDFEGSMISGIEEYNRKFGAIQDPYFSVSKVFTKNPMVKLAINYKLNR